MDSPVTNIKIAGLGGMGVLSASYVLAEAAFASGYDVKKAEVHGMAQRGGSVASDIRFGKQVLSPMIPAGEIDYLLALAPDWADVHRGELKPETGVLLCAGALPALAGKRTLNMGVLGMLSRMLPIALEQWHAALAKAFPEKHLAANMEAFELGRNTNG